VWFARKSAFESSSSGLALVDIGPADIPIVYRFALYVKRRGDESTEVWCVFGGCPVFVGGIIAGITADISAASMRPRDISVAIVPIRIYIQHITCEVLRSRYVCVWFVGVATHEPFFVLRMRVCDNEIYYIKSPLSRRKSPKSLRPLHLGYQQCQCANLCLYSIGCGEQLPLGSFGSPLFAHVRDTRIDNPAPIFAFYARDRPSPHYAVPRSG